MAPPWSLDEVSLAYGPVCTHTVVLFPFVGHASFVGIEASSELKRGRVFPLISSTERPRMMYAMLA
jgi:hypothetical protein